MLQVVAAMLAMLSLAKVNQEWDKEARLQQGRFVQDMMKDAANQMPKDGHCADRTFVELKRSW